MDGMDHTGPKWIERTKMDQMNENGPNRPNRPKCTEMD